MQNQDVKIIRPQAGFQEKFVSSNVDFVIGGAAMGVGKSYAALLMAADQADDPNFRMVYIRRNIADTKVGGGGADEAQKIYGHMATIRLSDSPRLTFPSGAFIDFTHMADQDPKNVLERVRGWQYSCIYVDEATAHEWSTIRMLLSRNRSQARWSGKFRVTCNPKRRSWLRYWVDWYVDDDGYPIPERDGTVRYFYVNGDDITDVVLGGTKEEVYARCRSQIDRDVAHMNDGSRKIYTYRDFIKSYTFYSGKLSDNKALLENDPGYMASVVAMGGKDAQANFHGCWNVDEDDEKTAISRARAAELAENGPFRNGEKWLTCDLADTGADNCVILVWDGLHIEAAQIIEKSTPQKNCNMIAHMAAKHGVGENHIVYDAQRAAYMIDYFPQARGYISFKAATGVYARLGERLKDVTYLRLCELINKGSMSADPALWGSRYAHQESNRAYTFSEEFAKECAVVNFDVNAKGQYRLWGKKAMNRMLGRNRSMDLLDCCAMRMWPMCHLQYGQELQAVDEQPQELGGGIRGTIYDDSMWF